MPTSSNNFSVLQAVINFSVPLLQPREEGQKYINSLGGTFTPVFNINRFTVNNMAY